MSRPGDALRAARDILLGMSAYQAQPAKGSRGLELDDRIVEQIREALGGQLQQIPTTRLRWYLADLEECQQQIDGGDFQLVGQLYRAMRRDGTLRGLLGARTSGLVRLPKRYYGDETLATELKRETGGRCVFDDMLPPSELSLMVADGIVASVSIGELVPVPGRDFPVYVRLDPQYLLYRWNQNQWYYSSVAGLLPITPGDGRWVLHFGGGCGRVAPWTGGLWPALGRAFINKEHALLNRSNYSAKLANPARVAYAPLAATDEQLQSWFRKVMAWGRDTVFALKPGYEVKLLESKGEGIGIFQDEIDQCDREMMIALVGQITSTTGGSGFSSQELPMQGLSDLMGETGDALAYTINTQVLPPWVVGRAGLAALPKAPIVKWDTAKPKDRKQTADGLNALGQALKGLFDAMAPYEKRPALDALLEDFGILAEEAPTDRTAEQTDAGEDVTPELEEAREKSLKGDPEPKERAMRRAA